MLSLYHYMKICPGQSTLQNQKRLYKTLHFKLLLLIITVMFPDVLLWPKMLSSDRCKEYQPYLSESRNSLQWKWLYYKILKYFTHTQYRLKGALLTSNRRHSSENKEQSISEERNCMFIFWNRNKIEHLNTAINKSWHKSHLNH